MSLTSHRCCARLKNLSSKLGYFQSAPPSPLQGSCIHRKAINKDKHLSSGWYPTTDYTPHALRCLEGTTMSNRGHRPRIHDTPPSICLEGSTPEDGCLSLFIALVRMVTFYKEGGGMLPVWALRARSYKTRAEA